MNSKITHKKGEKEEGDMINIIFAAMMAAACGCLLMAAWTAWAQRASADKWWTRPNGERFAKEEWSGDNLWFPDQREFRLHRGGVKKYDEVDGVIYFSVTSDGTDGNRWVDRLKKGDHLVGRLGRSLLMAQGFKPTRGVTTRVALIKGEALRSGKRNFGEARALAAKHGFTTPNAEVACLIREMFSDSEVASMRLSWIAVMHEPIEGRLIIVSTVDQFGRESFWEPFSWLLTVLDKEDEELPYNSGYVFVETTRKNKLLSAWQWTKGCWHRVVSILC